MFSSMSGYRIHSPLGVGPHGTVHRATADRLGARPVALRHLPLPAGPARARLRRDAELIASLGHPGLAIVSDVVDVDDETVAVASTLGTHGTLADRRRLGHLPVDEAVRVMRAVADAIESAHGLGLVHGRVSATNVLFTDDGPVVGDLVHAAALGMREAPTTDAAAVVHLAASLVDPDDRFPRATAYRAVCRWSAESDASVRGFLAALQRLDHLAVGDAKAALPPAGTAPAVCAPPPLDRSTAFGLVAGVSLGVGAVVGAVATWLPAVASVLR